MDIKVYRCVISEELDSDLEVSFVSLVDRPAIEKNFLKFDKTPIRFALDEEKRVISGPAMLAELPIYRKDDDLGEYYVVFEKEAIYSIVQKFFKKGFIQNFNIFHDKAASDITIFESFMTDEARGILPMKGFEDAKDGSWFISAKVENDDAWERIKSGELKGFSVEGVFNQIPVKLASQKMTSEQVLEAITKLLNETDFTD
jgi:hypothetical protein